MLERSALWLTGLDAQLAVQANAAARSNGVLRAGVAFMAERLAGVEVGLMGVLVVRGGRHGSLVRMLGAVGLVYALSEVLGRLNPRQRPFVQLPDIQALVVHGSGRSFPSRHVASGLAMAHIAGGVHPQLGGLMMTVAALLGAARMAAGLHYPSDIAAGTGLGLLVGRLLRDSQAAALRSAAERGPRRRW